MMIFDEVTYDKAPSGVRIWRAVHGGYSWVIVYGRNGYGATYQYGISYTNQLGIPINRVPGGPWPTKEAAEEACLNAYLKIAFDVMEAYTAP